jgi:hypothetical protein
LLYAVSLEPPPDKKQDWGQNRFKPSFGSIANNGGGNRRVDTGAAREPVGSLLQESVPRSIHLFLKGIIYSDDLSHINT